MNRQRALMYGTIQRSSGQNKNLYWVAKRLMDIILAATLLVLLAPLMLVIAIVIKLDSPGPVFFIQKRVGSRRRVDDGKVTWEIQKFHFYKFRSMRQDADAKLHQAFIDDFISGGDNVDDTGKIIFKLTNDPRVTRIGRIIRKTSLDELPQLINVLKGEMSLVGPRPVPAYEFERYQGTQRERMTALPGITGLCQIKARGRAPFAEQISLDLEYIESQSLFSDLKILVLTVPAVLSGKGAK